MGRHFSFRRKSFIFLVIISLLCEPFVLCKRSGTYGRRGGSPSRGSSIRSRISSALGRRGSTGSGRGSYYGGSGTRGGGGGGLTGRLFGHKNRHNYGGTRHRSAGAGLLGGGAGGLLGAGLGRSRHSGLGRGGGGGYRTSMFRGSGLGSRSRSGTFKNMIVGAAAGYLAYKAGKAIIRNVAAPMMWNNRQYYWGPQYYPSHSPHYGSGGMGGMGMSGHSRTMCRMPIDPSDPVLGQVYMPDNSRPKEIVWSCEYHEECCGYECCPHGMAQQGMHGMASSSEEGY